MFSTIMSPSTLGPLNISALGTYRLPSDEKSDIVVEAAVTRIASTVTSEPNQQPLMIE